MKIATWKRVISKSVLTTALIGLSCSGVASDSIEALRAEMKSNYEACASVWKQKPGARGCYKFCDRAISKLDKYANGDQAAQRQLEKMNGDLSQDPTIKSCRRGFQMAKETNAF